MNSATLDPIPRSSLPYACTFPTPFGEFSLAVDDDGAVVGTALGGRADLVRWMGPVRDGGPVGRAREEIERYFAGELRTFTVALRPAGTAYRRRVWEQLRRIPYGETRTYGQIAARLESAPRAVGGAAGANPVCPFVPCHRVVGAGGALVGFAYGLDLKRRLLAFERLKN